MARFLCFVETRCDALKVATFADELRRAGFDAAAVLSPAAGRPAESVLEAFAIPTVSVRLGSHRGFAAPSLGAMAEAFARLLVGERPHAIVAPGRSPFVLAAALSAATRGVPIVRLDAGARWKEDPPFGTLLDHLATVRVARTRSASETLEREGLSHHAVPVSFLREAVDHHRARSSPGAASAAAKRDAHRFGQRIVVLASTDRALVRAAGDLVRHHPEVFLLHVDTEDGVAHVDRGGQPPERAATATGLLPRVGVLPALEIEPFVDLLDFASFVLTDDPDTMEMAEATGAPLLVPGRHESERDLVRRGFARATGRSPRRIREEASQLLREAALLGELRDRPLPERDADGRASLVRLLAALPPGAARRARPAIARREPRLRKAA